MGGLFREDPVQELADSLDGLFRQLEELGHTIVADPMTSGLGALVVDGDDILGGADPRREGVVLGE